MPDSGYLGKVQTTYIGQTPTTQVRLWLLRLESGYSGKVQVTYIGQTPTTQVRLWLLRQESGYLGKVQATYIGQTSTRRSYYGYSGKNLGIQARFRRRA